jgi:hypothetical protein
MDHNWRTIILTTTGGPSFGPLLEDHHLDNNWTIILTMPGRPSSGQWREYHHLSKYSRTIIWTGKLLEDHHLIWTTSRGTSCRQLLEDNHLKNDWRTIIWKTTGGPSSRQLLDKHHLYLTITGGLLSEQGL